MRFELDEIDAAAPDADERKELGGERERLRHAEGLRGAASTALAAIAGHDDDGAGAAGALAAAEGGLGNAAGVDPALDALGERVAAALLELADIASELRSYEDGIEAEPGRLEAVEERLALIERLERKHGGSIEAVIAHAERCRAEIERLEGAEELAGELAQRVDDVALGARGACREADEVAKEGGLRSSRTPSPRRSRAFRWTARAWRFRSSRPPRWTASAQAARRRSSSGSRRTRGCPSRRCATRLRAGSYRA